MPGKVFVTGGSGFVGQAVVEELLSRGYAVNALSNRQNITGGVTTPFSGFKRMAAGSLRDSQLLPSQALRAGAKTKARDTSPTEAARVTGGTTRASRSCAIPLPMPKPDELAKKAAEGLALPAWSGKAPKPQA
jgi:nucleoside-diphosphate-sugar epimerase